MAKKKKRKPGRIIILLGIIFLCIYGGIKSGEYFAMKLQKPVGDSNSALSGAKAGGKSGSKYVLAEDEMVKLTSLVSEFANAEHRKSNDRLASLIDHDYYDTFLKETKNLSTGDIIIEDINYKEISTDRVKVEVSYTKSSKKGSETITLNNDNKSWKVVKVER